MPVSFRLVLLDSVFLLLDRFFHVFVFFSQRNCSSSVCREFTVYIQFCERPSSDLFSQHQTAFHSMSRSSLSCMFCENSSFTRSFPPRSSFLEVCHFLRSFLLSVTSHGSCGVVDGYGRHLYLFLALTAPPSPITSKPFRQGEPASTQPIFASSMYSTTTALALLRLV